MMWGEREREREKGIIYRLTVRFSETEWNRMNGLAELGAFAQRSWNVDMLMVLLTLRSILT